MKYLYLFFLVPIVYFSCGGTVDAPFEKVIYEVVFREKLAGTFEKTATGAGDYEFYYTYTDRGRGPEFTEKISLNAANYPVTQSITGHNYRKVAIDESFSSKEGVATWKNQTEEASGDFKGNKLYFRHAGTPAIYEILAQLLLQSESGKVALYPKGEVELLKKLPVQLSNGDSLDLLVVKGLDLDPTYLWMAGDQMAGKISNNLHVIRADLSDVRLELKQIQDGIEDANLTEIAAQLTHGVEQAVIQHVNVFTAAGTLLMQQDVFVEGQEIKAIVPSSEMVEAENALVVDGTGKTLLPGMFDMHTHNDKFRGLLHLAGGVTAVRDLANNKQLKSLAAQFDRNEILGPRIVAYCGIIDGPGPFANQRNVVDDLAGGLAEVQAYKDLGYQQIKLYSSIKPEWVRPLAEKAHELGLRVSGHIPAYMTATQAINQGYDEIQHINMLFLNFLPDTIDTRTPLRFTMPAQHGADLDLNSAAYLDFVSLLKRENILVDPTLSIFENMFIAEEGQPSPTYSAIVDRFPLIRQRGFYTGGLPKEGEKAKRYPASFAKMLDVVADLFRQGVVIVPGTDGLPGFLYHRELELYVRAGIPTAEVLKMATILSAEITGVAETLGSIEVGKKADLILIDGNPLQNISDIRKVEWTMKGGNLYYARELYNAVGITHFE